jgi:hypothetical protein
VPFRAFKTKHLCRDVSVFEAERPFCIVVTFGSVIAARVVLVILADQPEKTGAPNPAWWNGGSEEIAVGHGLSTQLSLKHKVSPATTLGVQKGLVQIGAMSAHG